MNEPMLKKAMDTLEFLSQDAAARMAYDARMKALSDEKSTVISDANTVIWWILKKSTQRVEDLHKFSTFAM
ncbi:hypothetical protein [Paenibacillus sp. GCM10027626]|uniref:hypothetical protein n=1 Tax=Paenibacillus sp. GCM10027626 TaxID=3273411 RepID=UPI0036436F13